MSGFRLESPTLHLSENDVEQQCKDLLRLHRWEPIRLHAGRFRTLDGKRYVTGLPMGTPDYVCIHPRYPAFYLETKATKRALSKEQEQRRFEISVLGFTVCKADSVDELADFLRDWESK